LENGGGGGEMSEILPITREKIDAILEFLPIFDDTEFEFGKWQVDNQDEAVSAIFDTHPEVDRFQRTLYENGWIVSFDWPEWQDRAAQYTESIELLQKADLEDLRRLLTTHVRKERFCEGHLSGMYECGHLTAILRRMSELRDHVKL
jgi:O-acetyl-ADP-ribose deacetylase